MTVQAICAMKNTYSTINALPEELFTKILCYCVAPAGTYKATSWEEHVSYTLVCKHWRETLLSFPGYWACIPPLENKHLSEMLARSQNAPFMLRVTWETCDKMKPIASPAQHYPSTLPTERLGELQILAFSNGFLLDRLPTTPTPVLRSIRLEGIAHGLPPHVLGVPKPALQSLHLGEIDIPWEEIMELKPTFPALRTFEINSTYDRIRVSHLLQLLSSMGELETLFLYDAMSEGSRSLEQARTGLFAHVRLDHLSKLYVRGLLSDCTALMSHLTFPVSAQASVDFAGDPKDWTPEGVEQEMGTLISSFSEPQFSELAFAVSYDDPDDLEVKCKLRQNTSITLSLKERSYIDLLTIPGATKISFTETSWDPRLKLLPRRLMMNWARLLARHPGIKCVELVVAPDAATVSGHMRFIHFLLEDATHLLEFLDIPPSQQRPFSTTEPNPLLPALDNLHLKGMPFLDGDLKKLKKALKSILEVKDSSFHFFLKLEETWGFTESMFKELKAISPGLSVKWDHIVRDLPEPDMVHDAHDEVEAEGGDDIDSDDSAIGDGMESG